MCTAAEIDCRVPMNLLYMVKEGSKVPRKGVIIKRDVIPDPIYNDVVLTKLINNIMLDGKKGVAQEIVYGAFDNIEEKTGEDPLEVFYKALNNIMPVLEVKARRIGGATYQVPMEVRPERRETLGLRWLVRYSRARGEKTMIERLAKEIMDAANNTGASVRKRWQKQIKHSHTIDGSLLIVTLVEGGHMIRKEEVLCPINSH